MNQKLQQLLDSIQQSAHLSDDEKNALSKTVKEVDKELEITTFKLDRTEKVKRTTAILLEETIEELEQKRKAVEAQNKELEIESSLERVRTVAMSMSKPDDLLGICEILFKELKALGFSELRNALIHTFVDEKKYFTDYDFSEFTGGSISRIPYSGHRVIERFIKQIRENKEAFVETVVNGKEIEEWKEFRKKSGQADDPRLDNIQELFYYHYSIDAGDIGISTFSSIPTEKQNLLKRFRNVFDLAYKRYIDITQAIAQAKEAQIETSLERVRAQAMAMHKPDDMLDVCHIISDQLKLLQIQDIRNVQTIVINESKFEYINYQYFTPYDKNSIEQIDYRLHPVELELAQKMLSSPDAFYSKIFEGKDLQVWRDHRRATHQLPDPLLDEVDAAYYHFYSIGSGGIGVTAYSLITDEQLSVFKRFRNVFELAYRRYRDIEKAIAQAHEAQIETSLERVRAQAMAMRTPEDLTGICEVLYAELHTLGFTEIRNAMINIHDDDKSTFVNYDYSDEIGKTISHLTFAIHPLVEKQIKQVRSAEGFSETSFTGKELKEWIAFRKKVGEKDDPRIEKADALYYYLYSIGTGSIGISTFSVVTEEKLDVLKRFRNVFNLSYQRYTDIALAEAQAREAQIELALERIRARTMAMQKSEEIQDATWVLFSQFKELGVATTQASICIFDKEVKYGEMYLTLKGEKIDRSFAMEIEKEVFVMKKARELFLDKQKKFTFLITGKDLQDYNKWRNGMVGTKKWDESAAVLKQSWYVHGVFFSRGMIGMSSDSPAPEEAQKILERFTAVFDGTYTRFLDLQKAEAQTREAQIELGLERVRARAMAMQKSDELSELVDTVFKELTKLDFALNWCIINIIDEPSLTNMVWAANPETNKPPESYLMKFEDYPFHHSMMKGYQERKTKHVYVLEGKEKKTYDDYLFNKTEWKRVPKAAQAASRAMKRYVATFTFSNFGGLQTVGEEYLSEENLDILSRFGKVFDLTYTRFNDLQKAEAQAREAKIEAALERTRTQSMIMQHSKELDDTLRVFHEQVILLGISSAFSYLWLPDEDSDRHIFWAAWEENENGSSVFKSKAINYLLDRNEPATAKCLADWKSNEPVHTYHLPPAEVENYFTAWKELLDGVEKLKPEYFRGGLYYVEAYMKYGCFGVMIESGLTEDEKKILLRFSIEFERTYTRFLDLQKAEAQAREAQIEAALERVRSRSMGMQKSEELKEVIQVVYEQFVHLNINIEHTGFIMDYKTRDDMYIWLADKHTIPFQVTIPYFDCAHWNSFKEAKQKGLDFFSNNLGFEEKNKFYQDLFKLIPGVPKETLEYYFSCPGLAISTVLLDNVCLYIENFSGTPYTDEENNTLMRFGKVFQQTYTRFLDLQKAEAQAREAQIETALEKVRSRSLAMHRSEELQEVVTTVFDRLKELDIQTDAINLDVFNENKKDAYLWTAVPGHSYSRAFHIPYTDAAIFKDIYDGMVGGKVMHSKVYSRELKDEFLNYIFEHTDFREIPQERKDMLYATDGSTVSVAYAKNTAIIAQRYTNNPFSEDENEILKRFANVFEQCYTRFKDLQKAEAQAREAQIEASLERVRSKAMSMQKSEDLANAVGIVFEELDKLNLGMLRCGIGILNKEKRCAQVWTTTVSENNTVVQVSGDESMDIHPLLSGAFDAWLNMTDHSYVLKGEDLNNYYKALVDADFRLPDSQSLTAGTEGLTQYYYNAVWSSGGLFAFRETEFPEEAKTVLRRFADVFNLTYTRFNDLKQAEAQAKEAQIEVALERVRSRTLAMHKSDELSETAAVMFRQLINLGIAPNRLYINIIKETAGEAEFWITDEDGSKVSMAYTANMNDNASFKKMFDGWKDKKQSLSIDMQGEELREYFEHLTRLGVPFKGGLEQKRRVQHLAYFGKGFIGMASPEPQPEETIQLLERFAAVFNLTYTRFNDLQVAEAQTHKANIETALERVRARALAMQQPEELIEVAEVLRHEMGLLGVEELETCSIYIHDETINRTECWYALKDIQSDEKKLVSDHFPLNLHDTWVGREMENFYRSNAKQVSIVMQGANRKEWINYCEEKSIPLRGYYGEVIPDRTYHLYKFSHGAIGAASAGDISAESWDLLQRAASVFSLAYSRFKDLTQARQDLQRLKEEKQRAETALTELKATQTQLIQSEKMASLGELTAGIAHEIQNPLNFVNNFSEVSNELMDEMNAEIEKGDFEEAKLIANDIKQNLEKINHHGKRADAIVKGMLQHSRSSSATKEPTDINKLADEYLRLAYHGLRAKDKTFNATMKTDYDETLEKVNVIPQDIGRVILNLITNAFYVVNEKKKTPQPPKGGVEYDPTVSVSTKKINGKVEIKVADNGNGIPQKVLDKIFQPFFTTKPTGQGTGLGLSLSYDIVKAHGGEIKVNTKENEGTEFIIHLPV